MAFHDTLLINFSTDPPAYTAYDQGPSWASPNSGEGRNAERQHTGVTSVDTSILSANGK